MKLNSENVFSYCLIICTLCLIIFTYNSYESYEFDELRRQANHYQSEIVAVQNTVSLAMSNRQEIIDKHNELLNDLITNPGSISFCEKYYMKAYFKMIPEER